MDSFWLQDCALPHYPPLEQDETAQAAVIGGGIAGILCAYFLTQAGVRCVLVEADRICRGTTAHTTAKLTAQHGLLYAELLRRAGQEQAAQVLGANLYALETYRRLCAGLDCDWQQRDAVVYSRRGIGPLEQEAAALARLLCPAGRHAWGCRYRCVPAAQCGGVPAAGGRRLPYRQAGRLAGAGAERGAVVPAGGAGGPLGRAGLHDAGWRAVYRPVFPPHREPVCGNRL